MTEPVDPDDAAVCDRFLEGQEEALRHVQGWVEGVVHLGRWNFRDPQSVVQDVILKLVRVTRARRYEARSRFKTFVFSVSKHTCIDVYRRERLRQRVEFPEMPGLEPFDAAADPELRLARAQRRQVLAYIFQRLPGECRRLWVWVYAEGLAATEVGARLGITAGHARVRVHRCLEKARVLGRAFVEGDLEPEARP